MSMIKNAKALLRKEIKLGLKQMSENERARQSNIVTNMLLASQEYKESSRISVFLSLPEEVQTTNILRNIFEQNKLCYIPRYHGATMDMVQLHSLEDYEALPVTSWNIKQPGVDDKREDALEAGGLDLILMPGLAFSRDGDRLGRGKGYYDTYLSKYVEKFGKMPTTVALAYNEQICDSVPVSEHDQTINVILYENMQKT